MEKKKYYPDVSGNPDFPKMEAEMLQNWRENHVFEQSVANRPASLKGHNNEFVFYDGPPFANGLPHYGHLLTGFVKDIFARYQTIKGKKTERRFGWDCHGLPAEMGAEKELGISGRHKIVEYGIDKFNDQCRTSVMKFSGEWEKYVERQARWVDFKHGYKTMDKNYMESVIWAFKQLYDKGLVYESMRVMPYSWACETPLSNFETRMDNSYRERADKAVTVAFQLEDGRKILAWTTTPWTLPSNLALAVSNDIDYVEVKKDGETYILSASAVDKYSKELSEDNVVSANGAHFKGSKLVGLNYKPLFPYFTSHENSFKILAGDFVTEGDGVGVVHLAPGFGEDDQRVCEAAGIKLVCPVDNAGKFTAEIFDLDGAAWEAPHLRGGGNLEGRSPQQIPGGVTTQPLSSRGYSEETGEFARDMRNNPTPEEKKLWYSINNDQLGFKFRRQQPIDKYIADFFCAELGLIIEVDGSQHAEDKAYDDARTAFLESKGYKVLRFWNNEVQKNLEGVVEVIKVACAERNTPPVTTSPSPYAALRDGSSCPPPLKEGASPLHLSLKGRNVLETNDDIIKYLKAQGSWIKTEQYLHNYPHCWRTDTPLIYKAVPSWYVEVTKFKDRMVELNQQINWIPGHIRDGQFGKWLENARDWSISRNRFWGAPIPIWKSDNPKNKELYVFGNIKELEEFFNTKVEDLHRPFIDELTKPDPYDPQYTLRRVEDVFDCWFESGSMPYAQAHYPFENKEWFECHFPADFIVEYVAQTRGWFYTLMVLSTALFDRPPFLNCICHGVVLDEKGQKLSKRLNNYADPMQVFDTFGSDAMRWVMVSAPIMHGGELLIDKEGNMVRDAVRLVMKPIWNSYSFFALYANADGIKAKFHESSDNLMDRYILAKCKAAVEKIETAMDAYDTPVACKVIENFFEVLNNWYIRRNKERFWKSEHDTDKFEAYNTLYTVLHIMCRAPSPLLPLLSEKIWQGLDCEEQSVHLADFPDVKHIADEAHLVRDMDRVRDACNAALSIRGAENIRVRQPLASLTIVDADSERLADYADLIKDEVNVKEVKFSADIAAKADLKLKVNFPVLGKRLPEKMKDIIAATKQGNWKQVGNQVEVVGELLTEEECSLVLEPKDKKGAQALSTNDALVILDLNITGELKIEGVARDLVRLIQQSRKDADLQITDRIDLKIETGNDEVMAALDSFGNYIAEQTLAKSVELGNAGNSNHRFEQKIEGGDVVIGFNLAA